MTRTNAREIAIHYTFELSFSNMSANDLLQEFFNQEYFALLGEEEALYQEFPNEKQREYISSLVQGAFHHGAELDGYIEKYAVGWKFSRIGRVASSIMRVAMYEILYMPDIPNAASINDAVEIAKRYEDVDTVKFINGILGSFVRKERIPEHTASTSFENVFSEPEPSEPETSEPEHSELESLEPESAEPASVEAEEKK